MDKLEEFYTFLGEYADFMEEMESVQKEKLDSLLAKDLHRIESSISSQQAFIMRMNNIENKRIHLQAEIGFDGLNFTDLIENAPHEKRSELRLMFSRIKTAVLNMKNLNDKSAEVAATNIRLMGITIPKNVHGYETDPTRNREGSLLETKV